LHAEVALTSALPLQLELKKVTLNQGIAFHVERTSTASTAETAATKVDKVIVVITPVPHRAVATLQASVLELWL
jgi:hypothetical protein